MDSPTDQPVVVDAPVAPLAEPVVAHDVASAPGIEPEVIPPQPELDPTVPTPVHTDFSPFPQALPELEPTPEESMLSLVQDPTQDIPLVKSFDGQPPIQKLTFAQKFKKHINDPMAWSIASILVLALVGSIVLAMKVFPDPAPSNETTVESATQKQEETTTTTTSDVTEMADEVVSSPSPSPKASPTPKASPKTTPTPTPTPTATPSPTPTASPNAPKILLSYPSQGQSISLNTSQGFCVVDVPDESSGSTYTSGLQRRHSMNNAAWTAYAAHTTLCYSPAEGSNTLEVQYKNSAGGESASIIRQFNFHRISDITVTLGGYMYNDANCNATQDSGEAKLGAVTYVTYTDENNQSYSGADTDSGGNFSYSRTILGDASLKMKAHVVQPNEYFYTPSYSEQLFTFNSSNTSASIAVPMIHYTDKEANCH